MDEFWKFIYERQEIFHKRFVLKEPPPWTNNPILRDYKFTNVYRELDRGTVYLIDKILPHEDKKAVVFNVLIYRLFNKTETMDLIGFQELDKFDINKLHPILMEVWERGEPLFTSAFMVAAQDRFGGSKIKFENYLKIFDKIHKDMDRIYDGIKNASSMEEVFDIVRGLQGFGRFLAYEVAVDLNYDREICQFSEDDFVNVGPGCKKGLDFIYSGLKRYAEYVDKIHELRYSQKDHFKRLGLEDFKYWNGKELTLRSVEHALCEFSKYWRAKQGTGRPRVRFRETPGDPLNYEGRK